MSKADLAEIDHMQEEEMVEVEQLPTKSEKDGITNVAFVNGGQYGDNGDISLRL